MARASNSLLLEGFSGKLGPDFVVKQYKDKIVIAKCPEPNKNKKKTDLQKLKRAWFAEAVAYAKTIVHNCQRKAEYAKKLPAGKRVYNAAVQEYLKNKEGYSDKEN